MGRGRTDAINSPEFDADGNLMEFPVVDNLMMRHGLNEIQSSEITPSSEVTPFGVHSCTSLSGCPKKIRNVDPALAQY